MSELILNVDVDGFCEAVPAEVRSEAVAALITILNKHYSVMNITYFRDAGSYGGRCVPGASGRELHPPAACALDFVIRNLRKEERILDFGCGIGVLGCYLARLGYNVVGYDNWSQLPRHTAEEFQSAMRSPMKFCDTFDAAERLKPTVIVSSAITASRAMLRLSSVRWHLLDYHYVTMRRRPRGFRRHALYPELLSVFRRVSP